MKRLAQFAEVLMLGAAISLLAVVGGYGSPALARAPQARPAQVATLAESPTDLSGLQQQITNLQSQINWLWVLCGGGSVAGSGIGAAIGTARRGVHAHNRHPGITP